MHDAFQRFCISNTNRFVDVYAASGARIAQLGNSTGEGRIMAVSALARFYPEHDWVAAGTASGKLCLWIWREWGKEGKRERRKEGRALDCLWGFRCIVYCFLWFDFFPFLYILSNINRSTSHSFPYILSFFPPKNDLSFLLRLCQHFGRFKKDSLKKKKIEIRLELE